MLLIIHVLVQWWFLQHLLQCFSCICSVILRVFLNFGKVDHIKVILNFVLLLCRVLRNAFGCSCAHPGLCSASAAHCWSGTASPAAASALLFASPWLPGREKRVKSPYMVASETPAAQSMTVDVGSGWTQTGDTAQRRDLRCVQLCWGLSHMAQNSAAVPAHSETLVE